MRIRLAVACLVAAVLTGCSSMPVPGGSESTNAQYYSSGDDFKGRILMLQPGMGESQVLGILGRTRNDMTLLSREEVVTALYGGSSIQMLDSAYEREETRRFLQSLYGYRLQFKDVNKKHGFTSPLRVRTQQDGYNYTVNLIFQNGILLEQPVMAGGLVNDSSSRTFFDYLNPGTIVGQFD